MQGTSRLISTDSEGISGSPPYLSPPQQLQQQQLQNPNYSSAAASLLAVLSDDPGAGQQPQQITANSGYASNESQFEQNPVKAKKDKTTKPKAEPIKLKIKTTARLRTNADLTEQLNSEEPAAATGVASGGRSTRRTTTPTATASSIDNVPAPGTANYELYRTLIDSPSQSYTHPQYNHSHCTEPNHPNHPALADYQTFNQSPPFNSIASNIPDIDAQINSQSPSDTERGILPKKRRGRNKAAAKFEATAVAAVPPPASVVSPAPAPEIVTEEPVQKRQRGRRRHDEQPQQQQQQVINDTPSLTDFPNSSNIVTVTNQDQEIQPLANLQPKKRITAAAKKQYRDEHPIQIEQQAIEPASIPSPIEATPTASAPAPSETSEPSAVNRRGRKAKSKANQNLTNTEQMSQPEVVVAVQRPTRQTRHTANGNMTRVSDVSFITKLRSFDLNYKIPLFGFGNFRKRTK